MYRIAVMFLTNNPAINIFNMISLYSSHIFLRTLKLFCLFGLICFLQVSGLPLEVKAATNKDPIAKENSKVTLFKSLESNPWSNINGFRSAKFGMDVKSVYRAIAKDFKLAKSKVAKSDNALEKTTSLKITVPELFSTGGTAQIGYIFGYKSKNLMTVNVLWGKGAAEDPNGASVVQTANLLRTHFLKKRYIEDKLTANAQMSDNQTLVFRGMDKKKRMVLVLLTSGDVPKGGNTVESLNNISLLLSYVKDTENPDIREVSIKDDEF
jgi:hypothetical protein